MTQAAWMVLPETVSQVRHRPPCVLEDAENGLSSTAREWLEALREELQALDHRVTTTDEVRAEMVEMVRRARETTR